MTVLCSVENNSALQALNCNTPQCYERLNSAVLCSAVLWSPSTVSRASVFEEEVSFVSTLERKDKKTISHPKKKTVTSSQFSKPILSRQKFRREKVRSSVTENLASKIVRFLKNSLTFERHLGNLNLPKLKAKLKQILLTILFLRYCSHQYWMGSINY